MKQVPLSVFSVPKMEDGKSLVRFLAGFRGILYHWKKPRPIACTGEGTCKFHQLTARWKGYAPGQLWMPSEKLWVPRVIEVPPGLAELTGTGDLRGESWSIYRVHRSYGDKAVEGEYRSKYNSGDVPRAFDVQRTVEALYDNREILWDVPLEGFTQQVAECSTDVPPMEEIVEPKKRFATPEEISKQARKFLDKSKERNGTH